MFHNIGGKIKGLAATACCLGIAAAILIGFCLIASQEDTLVIIGIIVILVGSLLSWLGSILAYAFGQLVDNSDRMVNILNELRREYNNQKNP